MDALTIFGVISVALMVMFYALERRSATYIFAFGIACILAAVYGFLVGAWPFSVAEIIWSGVAFRRWQQSRKPTV
ncbi:MAG: hypothetical protein NUV98_03415 [Candidatus Roizmanbacteria bacterium]|nr:hypothetical protein [Candidatus Roizmanbacteria bacterium]